MKKGLYPGTFDPPTLGHLDIIQRSAKLVETLYVGIATNTGKGPPLFSVEERQRFLQQVIGSEANIEVVVIPGLVADFAQSHHVDCIFRGLRTAGDCDEDFRMALANRQMTGIETLFLVASDQLSHLSATLIREIAVSGQHLEGFVPASIIPAIYRAVQRTQ